MSCRSVLKRLDMTSIIKYNEKKYRFKCWNVYKNRHIHKVIWKSTCIYVSVITIMHRRHDSHVAVVNLESHPLRNGSTVVYYCENHCWAWWWWMCIEWGFNDRRGFKGIFVDYWIRFWSVWKKSGRFRIVYWCSEDVNLTEVINELINELRQVFPRIWN